MRRILIPFMLLLATLCHGQSTSVTLTTSDADAQAWFGGTWSVQLTSPLGVPCCRYVISGTSTIVPNQQQSGALDPVTGTATMTLTPNTSIAPAGTQWTFQVCALASPSPCFTQSITISGVSQTVALTPPAIRISLRNPPFMVTAYQDIEVLNGALGSQYYNLTSGVFRYCSALSGGVCTFSGITGGQITSGTANQFALYNAANSITSDANLNDGITTANVITALEPLATPQLNVSGTGGLTSFGPGGVLPSVASGSGGFGVLTGGLPQCNVNGSWFYCAYLSVGGTALTQNQANFSNTTPAAPTNGLNVQWQGSGTNISASVVGDGNAAHALCGNGVFGACTAGGATALSGLTNATGSNTLTDGNFPQTWNCALTTNSINCLTFGETSAATGTGENIVGVSTASASTATPLTVTQGSVTGTTAIPAFTINSTFNNASLVGNVFALNLTNTASNVSSLLANWSVGGSSQFQVDTGGDLAIAGSYHMTQSTGTLQACGGSSISCQSSTNGSNGPIQAQGEDSTSTGASAKAGAAVFRGGMMNSTPAAGALEGVVQLGAGYLKGSAIAAVGDVVCGTTTAFTVTDCSHTGPAVNIIGIANTTANPIGVVMAGTALVKFDGATTIGDLACMGTTTDGQAHDNGLTACAAGTAIGVIIANSGTIQQMSGVSQASTAMSSTLALVQLHGK